MKVDIRPGAVHILSGEVALHLPGDSVSEVEGNRDLLLLLLVVAFPFGLTSIGNTVLLNMASEKNMLVFLER